MKLYSDVFTSTEILSDSYKQEIIHDGTVFKVKSRLVVKKDDDVDIGCGNAFGGAGEDQGAGGNQNVEKVIDLVDAFQYGQTSFDIDNFNKYFRTYMKKLLAYLQEKTPDRAAIFKKGGAAYWNWIKEHFEELSFWTPSDYDTENSVVISYYDGEDASPTFLYLIDGLSVTKV